VGRPGVGWREVVGVPGAAVVNPDGTVTYTPAAGVAGTDTFTYTIDDGEFTSSAGVTVAVSPPPTLSDAGVSLREGRSGVTAFTVTLSAPSAAEVRVQFATQDGIAQAGSDYTAANGSVTFQPGVTRMTVTITVQADRVKEADETFFIDFTSLFGGVRGRGTILNDD